MLHAFVVLLMSFIILYIVVADCVK